MSEISKSEGPGMLPTYHVIVPERSDYAYSVTEQQLESHLARITARFEPGSEGNSPMRLTFDDGHASQFRYAFPLLQEHRVRAIFFAIVGWMDRRPDYMTWAQLREVAAAGHQVQSHGLSHRFLTACTDLELEEEVGVSRKELQQRLGMAVDAISMPYGRMDGRVIKACLAAGYTRIYTSAPKMPFRVGLEAQVLGRFMVKRSTTPADLDRILTVGRTALGFMNARYQGKLMLKRLLGDRLYHHLWGLWGSRKSLEEDVRKEY